MSNNTPTYILTEQFRDVLDVFRMQIQPEDDGRFTLEAMNDKKSHTRGRALLKYLEHAELIKYLSGLRKTNYYKINRK